MSSLAEQLALAVGHLRAERLQEAEKSLDEILRQWPGQADALHFLGVLRHAQGRSAEAVALIGEAIAAMPAAPGPWNNLGNVLLECQQIEPALRAYERSIELAPDERARAEALNNTGTVYRRLSRLADAEAAHRRAVAARPDFADAWYNLSVALVAQGRVHDGIIANSRAIALLPRHVQARDQVIRALVLLGERERAAELYREWLAEDPRNPVVQHQLAACLGRDAPERASDAYVQQVFDAFAASFDAKLESLHYRAPALVAQALAAAAGGPDGTLAVVDAGCGTGLCGPLVRPWARTLAGCDLSLGMLRRAHERRVYDVLHQAELVYYLDTQPAAFDAIVSADTFCYFGRLDAAFAAAHKSLRPGGWLVFTVEALADEDARDHVLNANGRYAHAHRYVARTLDSAGLDLVAAERATLRTEAALDVAGFVVAGRSRAP